MQNKSSSEVADQIATTLNQAVAIAKKIPTSASEYGQSSHLSGNMIKPKNHWLDGDCKLEFKSTDTVAASKLIAELQSFMTVDGLDFSVSDAAQSHRARIDDGSFQNFQRQAQTLLPVWGAKGYQLVSLEF